VELFVEQDAAPLRPIPKQVPIEQDDPIPDERRCVSRMARRIAQSGAIVDANRTAVEKIPDSLQ
jgi:hypothetical protein